MSKKLFTQLTTQLEAHIKEVGNHAYEIAVAIDAIKTKKLFKFVGHESFSDYTYNNELSLGPRQVVVYASLGKQFERLGYSHDDATEVLEEFGLSHAMMLLAQCDKRVALSTLRRRSNEYYKQHPTFTVAMDPDELKRMDAILQSFGMEISDTNRRVGVPDALMKALEAAAKNNKQPLKSVA